MIFHSILSIFLPSVVSSLQHLRMEFSVHMSFWNENKSLVIFLTYNFCLRHCWVTWLWLHHSWIANNVCLIVCICSCICLLFSDSIQLYLFINITCPHLYLYYHYYINFKVYVQYASSAESLWTDPQPSHFNDFLIGSYCFATRHAVC